MLEGLEISVLNLSEMILDNNKFRIDSDFFLKRYLSSYKKVKSKPYFQLKDIVLTLSDFSANGSYKTIAENFTLLDTKDFAYMVRSTDFEKSNFENDVKYIDEHAYNFLDKSKLYGGELLINKIGSPGRVYLMPNLNRPVSLGMNLFMIRLKQELSFSEKFLWIYFKTNFGQTIIKRKVNGTVPLTIDKKAVLSVYVPKFKKSFTEKIEKLIDQSVKNNLVTKQKYIQAENLLLEEIGLKDFAPSKEPVNIKSFKDSFGTSGRLDAEYYQPKYERIENAVKSYKNGFETLDAFIDNFSTGFPYKSKTYINEGGIPLIRINNIKKGHLDLSNAIHIPKKDIELSPKDIAVENDILISMSGTIGSTCKIPKGVKAVVNQRIMKITPKNYNFEVLPLVINSIIGELQLARIGTGGVQTNISSNDIRKILIPKILKDKQQQISDLIEESFALKKQSEHLLEVAKKAVEIAIEENEEVAINYIKENS